MSKQKFYASRDTFTWPNGAIGHRPGGAFTRLEYAIVRNCPVFLMSGTPCTAYAQGSADSAWTIPAAARINGWHTRGYFATGDDGPRYVPYDQYRTLLRGPRAPSRATRHIRAMADYSRNSGAVVSIDRMGNVSINNDVYLQGDDANQFCARVDALCKRYPSLPRELAELAEAKEYIDAT